MSYDCFSNVYDSLMADCDYKARADYLLGLFSAYSHKPKLLLDLCCGTGSLSVELAKSGAEVIAVDMSEGMLDKAVGKARESGIDMLCLCQDASELDLYGTVDGAVCTLDSINHIVDDGDLQRVFNRVSLFLEPDCLFIFDVNTEYKHENILGDNTFVIEDDDIYCVWQNFYDPPFTDISLDFFVKNGDMYNRMSEQFSERSYSDAELMKMAKNAGFEPVAVFDDMTCNPPRHDSERVIYVLKKR